VALTTLIAHLGSDGTDLTQLVNGIDGQSLSFEDFDVVFVVDGPAHPQRQRLEELAARRPNVQVITGADAIAAHGAGDWLVYLGPQVLRRPVQLRPRALELLVAHAKDAGVDVVVGRTDADGYVHDLFAGRGGTPGADMLSGTFAVAYRRSFAAEHGIARDAADAARILAAAGKVGVFGAYPVLLDVGRPAPVADRAVTVGEVAAEWVDGRLRVQLNGTARAAGELCFALENGAGGQFWLAESRPVVAGEQFTAIAEIDVLSAALGAPLTAGVWELRMHVQDPAASQWSAQVPVSAARIRPALLGGTLVAPVRGDSFGIDVGATAGSAVPRFAAADVKIVETAAGTLRSVPLPTLYATGTAEVAGFVLLDKFKLHAVLSVEDGAATLTCKLSGLAGSAALGTQFGAGKPAPTGLSLEISPTGQMSVGKASKKAPAKPTPAAAATPAPLMKRVRRTLARNKTARTLYRRFAKR
jgi:hypothetical protein